MMMIKSCSLLLVLLVFFQWHDTTAEESQVYLRKDSDGKVYVTSDVGQDIVIQPGHGGRVIINGPLQVCDDDGCRTGCRDKLGSRGNPAGSCKAILEDDPFAENGAYYIHTGPYTTKVYCYMDYIAECNSGGWTTVMKTDGHKQTFTYHSTLWENTVPYHVTGGQSGVDHQETKLPTYWTMPFTSLCLGMKTTAQSEPKWIRLNYTASSLYSVIADGRYRSTSLGRDKWKSLVVGSSLQLHCNKEGFNYRVGNQASARIGIVSNNQADCGTPDSRIGFGTAGTGCSGIADSSVSTGNVAVGCQPENGNKTIRAFGYILVQ